MQDLLLVILLSFSSNSLCDSHLGWRSLDCKILDMGTVEPSVSSVYKYFFLYIEPISALTGAYYALFQQQAYLDLTHGDSSPKLGIPISTQVVLTQLANLYFLFALNEALILRATSDLKVWRNVLFCLLVADIGHLYSVKAIGSSVYWNVINWNAIDWGNVGFVYVCAALRFAFLFGYGVGTSGQQATRRSTRRKRPSSRIAG